MDNFDSAFEDDGGAEERRTALAFVQGALAEAIEAGVDTDCFAQVALFTAMQELVETYGEQAVADFAGRLPERIKNGEFSVGTRH